MLIPNLSTIFICGVTCAGKTTLSKLLLDYLHCDVIFIEEILRSEYPLQRILSDDIDSDEFFPHIRKKIEKRATNLAVIDNFLNKARPI